MDWTFLANCFVTLLAILDPVGAVAIYLSVLADAAPEQRRRAARRTALTVLVTLTVAALAGRRILEGFGISLAAFQVAGGAVILSTGFAMLRGGLGHREPAAKQADPPEPRPEVLAVVPLGVPIIAGAGSISTAILFEHRANGAAQSAGVFGVILACGVILFLTLRFADGIRGAVGETGMNIVTRLLGLILTAMGVQFIADGTGTLFPGLRR